MPQPRRELVLEARVDVPKARPQGVMSKLYQSAAKRWPRLRAAHYLTEVMQGMAFKDGLRVEQGAA